MTIRPFAAGDQAAARRLVLAGLGERFGFVDESLNPDLDDVAAAYVPPGRLFVVGERHGRIVGTGALIEVGERVGRIVRVSVDREQRGRGIGRALVAHLLATARARGYVRLLVETNDDWADAIALYRSCGFAEEDRRHGEVHLALALD